MKKLSTTLLLTIAVFAAALFAQLSYYDAGINLSDEGLVVEGAHQYAAGTYQPDVFAHYSSRYMFESLLLRGFGDRLLTLRAFWAVLRAATVAMIFWCIAVLAGANVAFPMALIAMLLPGPWHKTWIGFITMLVVVALLFFRRRPRQSTAALCGLAVGFAFGIHPYTGLLLLPAVLIAASRAVKPGRDRRQAPLFALGGAFLGALIFAGWARRVDWGSFFGRHWSIMKSDILWPSWDVYIIFATLLVALGLAILVLIRRPSWLVPVGRADLFSVTLVAAFSMPKMLARFDISHVLQNWHPFLLLIGVLLSWGWRKIRWTRPLVVLGAVVLAAITLFYAGSIAYYVGSPTQFPGMNKRLEIEFAPVRVNSGTQIDLQRLVYEIHRNAPQSDDPIFVAPFAPMIYALADRPNVVPLALFDRPENLIGYPEEKIIADLQALPPKVILLEELVMDGKKRNSFENVAPHVNEWIFENYEISDMFSGFTVLTPKQIEADS